MTTYTDWIRVSCAGLCRIKHGGRYLLLVNRNRFNKGVYELAPIGGGLQYTDRAIIDRFEAMAENPNEPDLRLLLPRVKLPDFRDWFARREGRETTPFRELQEELVGETKLLPSLAPEDIECAFLRTVEEQKLTQRAGQTGLLTNYFLEIYDITFKSGKTLGPLLAPPDGSMAKWVTEEQMRQGAFVPVYLNDQQNMIRVYGYVLLD